MLQSQFKHICGAADQTHTDAVQDHTFAALEHHGRQVLGLHVADEPPEAGGNGAFRVWVLQDYGQRTKVLSSLERKEKKRKEKKSTF